MGNTSIWRDNNKRQGKNMAKEIKEYGEKRNTKVSIIRVFACYLRQYRFTIFMYIIFILIFRGVFCLYQVEKEAVFYGTVLYFLLLLIVLPMHFIHYYLKHKELFELNLSKRIISGIAVLLLFVGSGFVYAAHLNEIDMSDKPVGLYLAIKKHPERYFVLDPNTATEYMTYTDNYVHPLWGFSSSFLDNIDTFGAFQRIDDRRKHNLNDNIYEAAVESKYVFIIDNSITFRKENYFTKYYSIENEPIVYSQAEEISGYKIYKIYTD